MVGASIRQSINIVVVAFLLINRCLLMAGVKSVGMRDASNAWPVGVQWRFSNPLLFIQFCVV
jgi:hypothetical protein